MNGSIRLCLSVAVLSLFMEGCAYKEMTYFRKPNATVAEERTDWGLCGGNFLPDGQVQPVMDEKLLNCMSKKGYQSINDYYVEQQISFKNRANPTSFYIASETVDNCGFSHLSEGLCKHERYILKRNLSRAIACMSANGYEATLPRYKSAYRIIDNDRQLSGSFCLSLTPRSGKGGVSLGGARWE
ncbi:MAG: hypothetical protein J0M01_06525 [Dechloromonas sp.]|jgi:hypothetical protein|nr:hypothetical protein [Dechloromonas sp.]